jgi:hypothetical protein
VSTISISHKEPFVRADILRILEGTPVKAHIKGVHVNEVRKMKLVNVRFKGGVIQAYADCVTGSLYDVETRDCLSSANLWIHVIKRPEKKKPTAKAKGAKP